MDEHEREGLDGRQRMVEVLENTQRLLAQGGEMAAQATSQAEEVADSVKAAASELVDLRSKAEVAPAHAAEILALNTSAKDLQGVIAAKSDHIEQAQAWQSGSYPCRSGISTSGWPMRCGLVPARH